MDAITDFINKITAGDIMLFVTFISIFLEVTPITFNPLSFLASKIGTAFHHSVDTRIEEYDKKLQDKIDKIDQDIDELQKQNKEQFKLLQDQSRAIDVAEVNRLKLEILNFGNKLGRQYKFTAEEYRTIMDCYSRYHIIIDKYDDMQNGKIDIEYNTIVEHYEKNKENGEFRF